MFTSESLQLRLLTKGLAKAWANFYCTDMNTSHLPHSWRLTISLAKGEDILEYLQDFVKGHGLDSYFRLQTRVIKCEWDDEASKWTVTLRNTKTLRSWTDTADGNVVILAIQDLESNTHTK